MLANSTLLPQSLATYPSRLSLKYAEFGNPKMVFPGFIGTGGQVHSLRTVRDEGVQVGIYNSVVLEEGNQVGFPTIEMYSGVPNNFGDSGGGVWYNGRVVGNMWGIVPLAHQPPDPRHFYSAEVPLSYGSQ